MVPQNDSVESSLVVYTLQIINLVVITNTITKADINPPFPISVANFSNFSYKGVASGSSLCKISWILPTQLDLPTTIMIIFPEPVKIFVPDIIKGERTSCLLAF